MNVNQEQLNRTLVFLRWKLEHNSKIIDEIKIANYLKSSIEEAANIMEKLSDMRAIILNIKANCPICKNDFCVEDINISIKCNECGNTFSLSQNKRYLHYYYTINESHKEFRKIREYPQLSIVSKYFQGDINNMNTNKVNVFLSYCHADEDYKNKLNIHLSPLKRMSKINEWDDRELKAGTQFDEIIKRHLEKDDVIILLISADFINSDYCYNTEMQKAMERCKKGQCKILPIIVRPCLWNITPLKDFLALPKDGKPLSTYENEDIAYLEIVEAINQEIDSFR